jgi:GNAT superfamily N-acetyltransferase
LTSPEVSPAQSPEFNIVRVQSPQQAIAWRPGFVGAYQTIFSEPPYNERFYPNEAEGVLQRALQTPGHITLMAIRGRNSVVGFGFAVPLVGRPDVARHMHGLLPIEHTFYLAELGVLPSHRGYGLGRTLIEARLEMVDRDRFSHVVLRTSATRHAAYELYAQLGFEDIGVYMDVSSRRVNGSVTTDRRLFLSKVL